MLVCGSYSKMPRPSGGISRNLRNLYDPPVVLHEFRVWEHRYSLHRMMNMIHFTPLQKYVVIR
jgi:hypothetical protein